MAPAQLQPEGLTDDQLLDEIRRLAHRERAATADLLRCLVGVDTRRLYLREGCASLFTYCTQVLHLAEGAAYNRIEVRGSNLQPSVTRPPVGANSSEVQYPELSCGSIVARIGAQQAV